MSILLYGEVAKLFERPSYVQAYSHGVVKIYHKQLGVQVGCSWVKFQLSY